jgi:hypothetical protein
MMKKIILLTDSRGVHKPAGSTHKIYAERLAATPGIELTSLRCPYKWTTIPDLLALLADFDIASFDHIILHAGIVDHSPRALTQTLTQLYNPVDITPSDVAEKLIEARNFSQQKIVNRKKIILDSIFGEKQMRAHFKNPYQEHYEGDETISLYSLKMLEKSLVPKLQALDKLIFIGSNNIVAGWQGDYPKPRPDNIAVLEDYSRILCDMLPNVINLHQWSDGQVKQYTCDNLHLTGSGSDWIYKRIMEMIGLRTRNYMENRRMVSKQSETVHWPLNTKKAQTDVKSIIMKQPKPLKKTKINTLKKTLKLGAAPLATMIIGVRFNDGDESRLNNLKTLLDYMKKHYADAFEMLIVEQDAAPNEQFRDWLGDQCRYEFLYNPNAYNRGWLYNVAAKHFSNATVIGFIDTDILPGENFLQCVLDCYEKYDAISPNRSLFYATEKQTKEFRSKGKFDHFEVTEHNLNNPTTLAGGMLIVNREKFLSVAGFEQYVGYGCEDRALDVTLLTMLPSDRVRMDSFAYFHQHHPKLESERAYFDDIYAHLVENYGCEYSPGLTPTDYIHAVCQHHSKEKITDNIERRISYIGDPEMYVTNSHVTINGLPGNSSTKITLLKVEDREPTFPPNFDGKTPYNEPEELTGKFKNAWAPAVHPSKAVDDTEQLQFFYNRYKGKRCFIVGNGPSLNKHDLSLLNNEYSFAVNSIYYKTREDGFKPTFFVVEDSSVINENKSEILSYDVPFKFFPAKYQSLHPKQNGTYFFNLNRGFYETSSPNYAIPRFSTDISKVVYCGQSVTYVNLQLAYFMGFTEVYLIGMDFDYIIPKSHKRTGDVLLSDTDDPNHFHKDYFGKGKTWKDPKLDRVLMNYKMAKLAFDCAGRKICNATHGGHLEEFERVNYDGLFGGLDKRFNKQPLDLSRPAVELSKLKQDTMAEVVTAPTNEVTKINAPTSAKIENPVDLYLIGENGSLTLHELSVAEKQMKSASSKGVLLYTDPRHLLAQAMENKADPSAVLEKWKKAISECLVVFRKNRSNLTFLERGGLEGIDQKIKDSLAAHDIAVEKLALAPLPVINPLFHALADVFLNKSQSALQLLSELQASSFPVPELSRITAPDIATILKQYDEMQVKRKILDGQIAEMRVRIENKNDAAVLQNKALNHLQQHFQEVNEDSIKLRYALDHVYSSTSWRITKPMRSLKHLFR